MPPAFFVWLYRARYPLKDKIFVRTKLKAMQSLLNTVSETFADAFDIDMSKFDFLFDGMKNGVEEWADLSKELIGTVLDASLQRYEVELQEAQRTRDLILNNDLSSEDQKEGVMRTPCHDGSK